MRYLAWREYHQELSLESRGELVRKGISHQVLDPVAAAAVTWESAQLASDANPQLQQLQ